MPYRMRNVSLNEMRPQERRLSLYAESGADQVLVIRATARIWAEEQELDMRVCEAIWSEAR